MQGHIVKALQARFREFRRNKVDKSALPANVKVEFAFKNRAGGTALHPGPKSKKMKLDTPPSGEDAASFARHNQKLKSEHTKAHPNKAVVQELMRVTFEMRRHDIINNTKRLTQITEDYPFLKCPDEVSFVFANETCLCLLELHTLHAILFHHCYLNNYIVLNYLYRSSRSFLE